MLESVCIQPQFFQQKQNSLTMAESLRAMTFEWASERSHFITLLADYKSRTDRQAVKVRMNYMSSVSIGRRAYHTAVERRHDIYLQLTFRLKSQIC